MPFCTKRPFTSRDMQLTLDSTALAGVHRPALYRNGLYCRRYSVMKTLRKVAVLIDTSREMGRGLLRGITRFHREKPRWTIVLHQRELGSALPSWIKSWRGDGILACIESA